MKDKVELIDIVQATLGTFDHRQSFTPGMFEPLKPLFTELGYEAVAIYIVDDYPDRMSRICTYGDESLFPPAVVLGRRKTLSDELTARLSGIPGLMTSRLFNHERELGVIVAVSPDSKSKHARAAFDMLARSVSVMAYVERIRTNDRRERLERDVFFAQSLTNRLLIREVPKMKDLRLGFEFVRSLEAAGDFFDLIPEKNGGLFGFIGSCNGKGLRTVLEVAGIMRVIHRATHVSHTLADVIQAVNDHLVKEKHRAHQASLALFHIDPTARRLRVAKSGRIGMLRCGPGADIDNISAPGSMFLGMMDKPEISEDEFEFHPGQSIFCVTEGFYSARDRLRHLPQIHWFLECAAAALAAKRRKPLANVVFDMVNRAGDAGIGPDDSMLALSVEFLGKNRDSVRIRN